MKGFTTDGLFTLWLNDDWPPAEPTVAKSEKGNGENVTEEDNLKTTYCESVLHIFRTTVGTGILSLPSGFSRAGYLGGAVTVVVTSFVLNYCALNLVESHNELSRRRKGSPQLTYCGTIGAAIEDGPKCLRNFKVLIEQVVNVLLLFNQCGSGIVYVIFLAMSAQNIFDDYLGEYSLTMYTLAISLPIFATNMVLRLKRMTVISGFGNVVILLSIFYIFYYCVVDGLPQEGRKAFGSWSGTLNCLGIVFYSSGCTAVVLPLNSEMKRPVQLTTFFGVLNVSTTGIAILYVVFGWICYLKFGSNVKESVTLNLEQDLLSKIVQLSLILSTLTSFTLTNFITHSILWNDYLSRFFVERRLVAQYALKFFIVSFQIVLAILVPSMSQLLSFSGMLSQCSLGLALPCLVRIFTFYDKRNGFWRTVGRFYREVVIIIASCALIAM